MEVEIDRGDESGRLLRSFLVEAKSACVVTWMIELGSRKEADHEGGDDHYSEPDEEDLLETHFAPLALAGLASFLACHDLSPGA